jgi:hypothetical protein
LGKNESRPKCLGASERLFPLTPALSLGERGKRRPRAVVLDGLEFVEGREKWLPLPEP